MYVDKLLEFADGQAFSADAASTNVIDLGEDRDIGPGTPLWLVIMISTALDAGNADETYAAVLQTDSVENFASPAEIGRVTFTRADPIGTTRVMSFPYGNERFVRLFMDVGGTTPSGAWSAFLTDQEPRVPGGVTLFSDGL